MSDQAPLTAEQIAQRLAVLRPGLYPRPGMTDRERGRLEGAADMIDFVLRELSRVPGVTVPDLGEPQHDGPEEIADVLPLRRRDDSEIR